MEKSSYETLFDAYYFELASDALKKRWQGIDTIVAVVVMISATGAAAFGFAMLRNAHWLEFWRILAGIASLASIINLVLGIPRRIMDLESLRRIYSGLRVDIETFRQNLRSGLDNHESVAQHGVLRRKLSEYTSLPRYDAYLFSRSLQETIKKKVIERIGSEPREK